MKQRKILLIEDDDSLRAGIETFLARLDYELVVHTNVEEAIKSVGDDIDLIISDVKMPGDLSGYDLLKYVRKRFENIPIILMTGFGTIEAAVEAMKNGAYDFLIKPFSLNVLETAIRAAFLDCVPQKMQTSEIVTTETDDKRTRIGLKRVSERFITAHSSMREIIENLKRIAPSKATVLIQGESGTGKELLAKMIHEFSPRSDRIFVAINCAAMPDTLLESELFGHEKGAFTGAVSRQIGKFELSNNGTILLDEISEMSLTMQTKLLRVLQECEIYRVGGNRPIPLNLRVIATTNRDLYQYMREGNFREDLFYRLNVIPIMSPPLRDRGEDIIVLAEEFINEFSVLHARKPLVLDSEARGKLLSCSWPGNVRELRNAMERAVLVGDFSVIEEGMNIEPVSKNQNEPALFEAGMNLSEIEKRVILKTLDQCGGNKTKTANQLGISLRTLRNKLKTYGMSHSDKSA